MMTLETFPNEELRFYCFVNFYLSQIQQGIQTGHAAVDLVRQYAKVQRYHVIVERNYNLVNRWADDYKTFITLNGGNLDGINEATTIIRATELPMVKFYEDEVSLGGIQTCVGVVLPQSIFNAKKNISSDGFEAYTYTDIATGKETWYHNDTQYFALIQLLRSSRLA